MSRLFWIGSIAVGVLSSLLYLFVSCATPSNPFVPSNAKIYLSIAPTSTLKKDNAGDFIDSVGNTIKLGITCNLPEYIDSIIIQVISPSGLIALDTVFKGIAGEKSSDTIWYNFISSSAGNQTIKAQAFIQQNIIYPATDNIIIYSKPVIHSHPHLVISGTTKISFAQTCSLSVLVQDSNAAQLHTFYVKQDTFTLAAFTPPFKWTPPTGFIGTSTLFFKVSDTDSPSYFDTSTVIITVSDTFQPSNTKIFLIVDSTATLKKNSVGDWVDTVNDTIKLGVSYNSPEYIDSIQVQIESSTGIIEQGTVFKNISEKKITDTIWYNFSCITQGVKTINAQAFIQQNNRFLANVNIDIFNKPIVPIQHSRPHISINGSKNITPSQICSLSVTVVDSNPSQAHTLTVKRDALTPITFVSPFIWTPPVGFIGKSTLFFKVADTDSPSYFDTATVIITVSNILVAPVAGKTIADFAVNKGQPASFAATVNADANPSPVFSWFKEGNSTSISANQTYTISQTTYTDHARYRYVVSNSQGSDTSNWITLTVKDVTKPVIVLKGANPQSIMVGGKYTELGDSAYDDKDGIITSKVAIDTSKVKLAQIGTYSVTYSVKDSAGNTDTITRTVQINGNAPVIGTISGNKETCINVAAVFSVSATGSQPLKYQWMKGSAGAPGNSTDSIYSITPLSTADAGSFYCVVSNGISPDAQSQNMTLTVDIPPAISSIIASPSTMPVCAGTQVTFTVTATGTAPLVYSWKKNGSAIATAQNSATFSITSVAATDSGQYSCTVLNGCLPSATSGNVQLSITVPPTISAPAASTTISKIVGDTVTLTVTASGTGTLSYQWYKGSVTVGTNSSTLPIKPIAFTDSGVYTCAVSNGCNSTTSKIITLSVSSRPTITTQPISQTLYLNQSATFSVVASGVPQPTYQWKKNGTAITGAMNSSYTISSPGISDSGKYTVTVTNSAGAVISDTAKFYAGFKSVAGGGGYSFFLKTDGTLWACGINNFGQLGDGTTTNHLKPVRVMSNVKTMAAGADHSLIFKNDGTLWACGNNGSGELGDGTTTNPSLPEQIPAISNVLYVASGANHSIILKTDGSLWACGDNSFGQLCDGTTTDKSSFEQITSINNIQNIAVGQFHNLLLKNDGTLWTCGANGNGQLGDGTTTNRSTPVQVTIANVQGISAGGLHSLMIGGSTLWGCGYNIYGQLGNGTNIDRSTPVQSLSNVQSISAGESFSLIIKNDGTLWACGANGYGQLGDGTATDHSTPIQISGINNAQSVAAGDFHSLMIKKDGTVWAWGSNDNGQLGDGTTTDHSAPVNISF
jgi:alpha-tubulin suppressor-like RCC1 family protein